MKKLMLFAVAVLFAFATQAQTVDEIINKYIENTGGKDKWKALKSMKTTGKVKFGGQEFPVTILQTEGGKQKSFVSVQGMEFVIGAFDGTTGWRTNQMNMKAEKVEAEESENMKRAAADFPDPFIDYAAKGYSVALEGKEKIEGTDCFKIKLTKKTQLVEGKEVENVVYYFFDAENYVPLVVRATAQKGPQKGAVSDTVFSDYQEVNGLFFPFSMTIKVNGQTGQAITFEKVELDVAVDDKTFALPAGN